jgi:hypothetical protein
MRSKSGLTLHDRSPPDPLYLTYVITSVWGTYRGSVQFPMQMKEMAQNYKNHHSLRIKQCLEFRLIL